MKSNGEVYLDQGVIHAVVPGAGTDAGGASNYGIQDIYFYDYNEKLPVMVQQKLANSIYFKKQIASKL